jgi:hypothetical protein
MRKELRAAVHEQASMRGINSAELLSFSQGAG